MSRPDGAWQQPDGNPPARETTYQSLAAGELIQSSRKEA